MILTAENYFSKEAEKEYFGSSKFKRYMTCEAMAFAVSRGEYVEETTKPMLVGSYVDAYFEGTISMFKAKHPYIAPKDAPEGYINMFTSKGDLAADFKHADRIIERIESDEMFMRFMSGKKQVIMTGLIFGHPWKTKVDSYHATKTIVDLKIMKDFNRVWVDGQGKIPFVEAWGYDIQAFSYQEVESQYSGAGILLPFNIAGATKEKPEPDIAIISVPQEQIDIAGKIVEANIDRVVAVDHGEIEPHRCEKCNYCRRTKKLTRIVDYREVGE